MMVYLEGTYLFNSEIALLSSITQDLIFVDSTGTEYKSIIVAPASLSFTKKDDTVVQVATSSGWTHNLNRRITLLDGQEVTDEFYDWFKKAASPQILSQSLVKDSITRWDYYLSMIPLYLKQSEAFLEHFKIWFDLFDSSLDAIETAFKFYDLFMVEEPNLSGYEKAKKYLDYINTMPNSASDLANNQENDISGVLDSLGDLYGIKRNLSVSYGGNSHDLSLNNEEFLALIERQQVETNYDGTYETAQLFYERIGLPIFMITAENGDPADCSVYLMMRDDIPMSTNLEHLFLAGILTLQCDGITYTHQTINYQYLAIWDSPLADKSFDTGEFA